MTGRGDADAALGLLFWVALICGGTALVMVLL
jgi:hypothetical protein